MSARAERVRPGGVAYTVRLEFSSLAVATDWFERARDSGWLGEAVGLRHKELTDEKAPGREVALIVSGHHHAGPHAWVVEPESSRL